MPRPLRVQFPGAIYHVTAQANRSEALFLASDDYRVFWAFLGLVAGVHEWEIHAWSLMTTHYHLLLTTPKGDLAAGMHRLNSRYAHWFNDAHNEVGHTFRRRYGAKLVETEEHLVWCYRYIAMNPVKARMGEGPCAVAENAPGRLFGARSLGLPSDEVHLFRHFGPGDVGRRLLRRYVELGY